MNDAAFVERVLELDGGSLPIRFHSPVKAPDGECSASTP